MQESRKEKEKGNEKKKKKEKTQVNKRSEPTLQISSLGITALVHRG